MALETVQIQFFSILANLAFSAILQSLNNSYYFWPTTLDNQMNLS